MHAGSTLFKIWGPVAKEPCCCKQQHCRPFTRAIRFASFSCTVADFFAASGPAQSLHFAWLMTTSGAAIRPAVLYCYTHDLAA